MSTAGGLEQAIIKGESIGCTAIGIFTKSNRQWLAKDLTPEEITLFKKTMSGSSVEQVVAHACYLINLAAGDPLIYQKSIDALQQELLRCEQLNIPYLVLHPGSAGSQTRDEALQKIAHGLDAVLNATNGKTMILLETMAGQGTSTCATFEDLAQIRAMTNKREKIGICLDTCHIFAAGYDIATAAGYAKTWRQFDETIGLSHLKAFHLNDSLKDCASRVDRHADIGEGKIGLDCFSWLINDPRFFAIPKIIETPKGDDALKQDLKNLTVLRGLFTGDDE